MPQGAGSEQRYKADRDRRRLQARAEQRGMTLVFLENGSWQLQQAGWLVASGRGLPAALAALSLSAGPR